MSRVGNQNVDCGSGLRESLRHEKHKALWTAHAHFGIEPHYISLLKSFFADQKATVLIDKESDMFEIKRGTKQGDPLSSLLFNTVLQAALEEGLARWREKGMGISLGVLQADCFSNPWFADDVLLLSTSLKQLRSMMCDFGKSRKRLTENPPGKNENSQQPRIKHKKRAAAKQ